MATSTLLEPEFLRKLQTLSLTAKRVFTGQLKGEKRSVRRGTSVEFADYREYTSGDDLRYVDWNLYARLEKMFLKLFVEEEDLHVYIAIDTSRSMAFGEPPKIDYARRVAAALGYIGLTHFDRIGVSAFAEGLKQQMPPVRGKAQVFRFFDFLQQIQADGKTHLTRSLREFSLRATRTGVVVVLSDLFDPDYEAGLKALAYRNFQVIVIHILDESELRPGFAGDLKLVDSEIGETREITVSQSLLSQYRRTAEAFCDQAQATCSRYRIDYLRATTALPFEDLVLRYLRKVELVR